MITSRERFKLFYSKSRKAVLVKRYMGTINEISFESFKIPFSEIKSSSTKITVLTHILTDKQLSKGLSWLL